MGIRKNAEEQKYLADHRRELTKTIIADFDKLIQALASGVSFYYGCDSMPITHVKEIRDRVVDIWWDVKALDKITEREDGLLDEPLSQNESKRDN
jgi:hypothetical protein